ncbi:MAG: cytochrome bc1 complex diheme cytochrome c subunit [Propionibacteriaceae bacterium]
MRFLSSRRRHPAAKPLLLLLALFVMGALYSVAAPSSQVSADTGTSPEQVAEGEALFAVGCASCHGLQGEGTGEGPTLVGVGAAAVDFQVATGRMPMAKPGAQAPRKENRYSQEEIAQLAAFVASLGAGPAVPDEAKYNPEGLSADEIARGGELFRTNCSACHNFAGSGGALPNGKYAPSLEGVSNKHLYQAMLTGPQQMPVFSDEVLTPKDKAEVIGYLNTLNEQPQQGGLTLGGLGPVSEGFWAWVLGIGGLIGFAIWITAKGARAK